MPLDAADEVTVPDWTAALTLPPPSTLCSPPNSIHSLHLSPTLILPGLICRFAKGFAPNFLFLSTTFFSLPLVTVSSYRHPHQHHPLRHPPQCGSEIAECVLDRFQTNHLVMRLDSLVAKEQTLALINDGTGGRSTFILIVTYNVWKINSMITAQLISVLVQNGSAVKVTFSKGMILKDYYTATGVQIWNDLY